MMTDKKNLIDVELCPAKTTAEIFGCSSQQLRLMIKAGAIKQTARGKYDLREVAKYFLQANIADMSEIQKAKLENEREKLRRVRLENDEAAGILVKLEDVHVFLNGYTGELMQFVESIKKSIGAMLDNENRKKFYKKHEAARTELAYRFETWRNNARGTSGAEQNPDSQ